MQEIYYETTLDKKWGIFWFLSITVLPLLFSYFYFDGYYFKVENMVPLVLVSIFLGYLFYQSKNKSKEIKFIIDGDFLTKITPDTKVSVLMKDINYFAIYRREGKEPNTVDTSDDSGIVNFSPNSRNLAILLIKTNQGVQLTIKLAIMPLEKIHILIGAILSNIETNKDSITGFNMLQDMYNSNDIVTALSKSTIRSMSERNKSGVTLGRWFGFLVVLAGFIIGFSLR